MDSKAKVVRETPSQRRHYRLSVPLQIFLEGQQYPTVDWSIGGFRIRGFSGLAKHFDELDARIAVSFSDFNINFDTRVRIIRYDAGTGELAAEFFALDERQQALLKYFSEALIQGEMVPIENAIKRIDIPVTPVSEKPDPVPGHSVPLRRRSLKTLAISSSYVLFSVLLAYYAANTLYVNLFKLRVDMATLTGPDRVIKAPISGVIDEVYTQIGEHVTLDDPLFYIRNDETLERIELAKIEIRDARTDLKEKEQKLKSQLEKLESYREFGVDKLQIAKAKTIALKEKVRLAEKRQKRTARIYADGASSEENLDRAVEQLVSLRADLKVAIAQQHMAARAIEETYQGRFFTDHRLEGEVDELESAVQAAQERVVLEQERLKILESRRQRLVVSAPIAGEIVSLYPNVHQTIEKGEPLLLIEHEGKRGIEAFISAKELDTVRLDKPAKIIFRGKTGYLNARVTGIQRNSAHEIEHGNNAGPDDDAFQMVQVKLTFTAAGGSDSITALPSGLPVTVEFAKRSISDDFPMLARLSEFFLSVGIAGEKQAGK